VSDVGLIIPAAGSGIRLGSQKDKALTLLRGQPLLAWALRAFETFPDIVERVVVVPPGREDRFRERILGLPGLEREVEIVTGGDERQDSVARGLAAMTGKASWILVHDAARPLVSRGLIRRVLDALEEGESVVPALPLRDSVARAGPEPWIESYEDRGRLLSVQTPQGFHAQVLDHAFQRARADGFTGTDEASLVLRMNHPVTWTEGDPRNIKITYPEDLALAEAILSGGDRDEGTDEKRRAVDEDREGEP
jgi:2-C-methyl-D-erythritol 4-phosphate cytidylyltransferase